MKSRILSPVAAFAMLLATPVFASAQTYNVFLSGQVFKGDELLTTFAAPVVVGGTLPIKNQDYGSAERSESIRLALTPEPAAQNRLSVSIKADWGSSSPSSSVAGGMINERVEMAQGETKSIPFGDCGHTDFKKTSCYKVVFSATSQH